MGVRLSLTAADAAGKACKADKQGLTGGLRLAMRSCLSTTCNRQKRSMRLLIINPNTTTAMTDKVQEAARSFLPADWSITAVSGRFGPRYIASRATFAVASHAAIDAFAAHAPGHDRILLACFGDPGLDALREASAVPVIGLVEASALEASAGGRRYSIVTGGALWEPMLRESLLVRGLAKHLASIRTVAPDGGMIARDPERALRLLADTCAACIAVDGAQTVILGGVGLIGLAHRIEALVKAPVICSIRAGLRAVLSAETVAVKPALPAPNPIQSTGLSAELDALLATRG
jgi:allantoin racemase